ncbi:RNA-binding S4 domain-containing protein [Desulfogranum mediterraneum]|uniref:RNA-binding S4 domain-containing protein n=1 Tax=Desulfogranum mediterraneum TaxID=160661 RepID=UPI00040B1FF1|nr:RNA-binding S4 domain-containing protein [Desulfogranum mediterraneum]
MEDSKQQPVEQTTISTPYIELFKLLKRENLAASGGEAKFIIGEGLVEVNGEVETRKRKKIVAGDRVSCNGETLEVIQE